MTEATIFSIYGIFALVNVLAWRTGRFTLFRSQRAAPWASMPTKPSFLLLFPLALALSALYLYRLAKPRPPHILQASACIQPGHSPASSARG